MRIVIPLPELEMRGDRARAIANCLNFLREEAEELDLPAVARLIAAACEAAREAAESQL